MRPAYVIALGMVVSALGMAMLTQVGADSGLGLLVAASVVMSVGHRARPRRSAWG